MLILVIPSIVIFLTVYFLFKKLFDSQLQSKMFDAQQENKAGTLNLKLQAYERLLLFCERVNFPTLILRASISETSARTLSSAMILMIQQEYEHNVTQQIYVSEKLWTIVQMAKNQMIEIISQITETLPEGSGPNDLKKAIMDYHQREDRTPIETAKLAIKREAGLLL